MDGMHARSGDGGAGPGRGDGGTARRGRVRVRGGTTRRAGVRVPGVSSRGASSGLGEGAGAMVAPPRGGGRGGAVRGRGGAARGRGSGSNRPGPSSRADLDTHKIGELPRGVGLEVPLHPPSKRQWQPSAPASRPPRQAEDAVLPLSPPPGLVGVPAPSSPPPPPSPSTSSVPSPAMFVECPAPSRYRRQLTDSDILNQLGSESESGGDSDDDGAFSNIPVFRRADWSMWETPLDPEDSDDPEEPAPAPVPYAAPAPAAASSAAAAALPDDVPLSATDQPWGLYEFDWKTFPTVSIPSELRREKFSESIVGPTAPCVDPYEIFISIWDRQFMEYIASETNRYAQQVVSSMLDTNSLHPTTRFGRWRDTNADELYVYFALVITMGVVVKSRIEEYWSSTPDIFYTPGFNANMSGKRFALLSKCLHFVNNETMLELELTASEAKLFKVQPLLSHLNNKFQSCYRLGQNIALDESLLQWKGWLDMTQLIPNEAAVLGIKTYEICESQTGYLWRFEIHANSKRRRSPPQQSEDPMETSTPAIVLRLTSGLEGKGHTLWMDNFYNSPCLARRLKTMGFDCVGTLRTNRKFVPQALHSLTEGNMQKGQITGLTTGDVDVMVWRDNNRVAMISTYHGNSVSEAMGSTKPTLIRDYNIMMGGVDKKDQMLSMYALERKRTKVWYKKLFRRLLNVSILNSYIIHRHSSSSSSPLTHRNFRVCLVKALLSKHCSSPSLSADPLPRTLSLPETTPYHAHIHYLGDAPQTLAGTSKLLRKCVICRSRVSTQCMGCNKAVCMESCFATLHLQ